MKIVNYLGTQNLYINKLAKENYMKLLFYGAFDNDKNGTFLSSHLESTVLQFNWSFQTQRLSRDTCVCGVQKYVCNYVSLKLVL
jgi:hypothetical protein